MLSLVATSNRTRFMLIFRWRETHNAHTFIIYLHLTLNHVSSHGYTFITWIFCYSSSTHWSYGISLLFLFLFFFIDYKILSKRFLVSCKLSFGFCWGDNFSAADERYILFSCFSAKVQSDCLWPLPIHIMQQSHSIETKKAHSTPDKEKKKKRCVLRNLMRKINKQPHAWTEKNLKYSPCSTYNLGHLWFVCLRCLSRSLCKLDILYVLILFRFTIIRRLCILLLLLLQLLLFF